MKRTFKFKATNFNDSYDEQRKYDIDVDIELKETKKGKEFSASAGVWNKRHSDYLTCGQCFDSILDMFPTLKKNKLFMEIYELWSKHHLNGMHAGTIEQEKIIEELDKYDYKDAIELLTKYNKLVVPHPTKPNTNYRYGTEWLFHKIPDTDLDRIKELFEYDE